MGIREKIGEHTGKFLNACVKKNSTFLFGSAAASWILASAAQTIGLVANKDIGKEEKKFLVPQEIMDGTFNILTYAAITMLLMNSTGKIAQSKLQGNEKAIEGAKTLAAVAGGVISSNLVTPVLRNKTSVIIQKKMEERNLQAPPPEIHDMKTYPNFRAKQPFSMQNYVRYTKSLPFSGSLKI